MFGYAFGNHAVMFLHERAGLFKRAVSQPNRNQVSKVYVHVSMRLAYRQPRTVLLVEDDPELSKATEMLLKTVGFSVRCEKTAAAARVAFRHSFPDVLITDIGLDGEDGLSLLIWAKGQARRAKQRLHAIVVSGHPDHWTGQGPLKAGANRYFRKPFDPAALLAEVIGATHIAPVGPHLTQAVADGSRLSSIVQHLSR